MTNGTVKLNDTSNEYSDEGWNFLLNKNIKLGREIRKYQSILNSHELTYSRKKKKYHLVFFLIVVTLLNISAGNSR